MGRWVGRPSGTTAEILIGLGLSTALIKRMLGEEFARIQAERNTAG
jgi:hypothetical protein